MYKLTAYSSAKYEDASISSLPLVVSLLIGLVFLTVMLFFYIYDRFVKRRNDLVIDAAARSNAVLLELFPKNVRDRMLKEKENERKISGFVNKGKLREDQPNADLFTDTTIMFADISGFTSWSSEREPVQVFILLETLYNATTAGVLRGDRARFQLFGDTMNTASRMESMGVPGRIQVSESTAQLLMDAGKSKWLRKREENVFARGKGGKRPTALLFVR